MRFYPGSDPMMWLTRTPVVVIGSCLAMIPVLMAEESMRTAECVGVGTGSFKRGIIGDLIRQWQRLAKRATSQRKAATAPAPEMLSTLGIGYTLVEKAPADG
jgi:hypothetical protein